jgi:hypothetical protein
MRHSPHRLKAPQSSRPDDLYQPRVTALARAMCASTRRPYGLHFTRMEESWWVMDHAFPTRSLPSSIEEQADQRLIRGRISVSAEFSGCPHCRNTYALFCSCGGIFCVPGAAAKSLPLTCPWCDARIHEFGKGDCMTIKTHVGDF